MHGLYQEFIIYMEESILLSTVDFITFEKSQIAMNLPVDDLNE